MNPLRYWLAGVLACSLLGVAQFAVVVIICSVYLPEKQIPEDGYFLSDLGRSVLPLAWLFNSSLIVLGLMLIPMFIMLIKVDARQSLTMRLATGFGILSCLGLICLGNSPVDRAYISHLFATAMWIFPMLYTVIAFYVSAARSAYVNVWFIGASLLMAVVMLVVFFRADATDLKVIQRMLVVSGVVWLGFMIWFLGLEGYGVIAEWEPTAHERVDRESQEYYQTLAVKKSARGNETKAPPQSL
ncbi:MAG: hypothetical protein KF851_11000 [Pirellulaceae bacterium]|nr:hypothetical protein [Pirellulaceae bacterium]